MKCRAQFGGRVCVGPKPMRQHQFLLVRLPGEEIFLACVGVGELRDRKFVGGRPTVGI